MGLLLLIWYWAICQHQWNVDGAMYRNILSENLMKTAKKLKIWQRLVFKQDNDPKHIAKTTQEWFKETKIKLLGWPSLNPDLNPIENKREKLKVALHKQSPSNL